MIFNYADHILPADIFADSPEIVAPKMLGAYLVRRINNHYLVGKIVEVEAYLADSDDAAHNAKGKTNRNKSLFEKAGTAYVHAMRQYHLIDVVTETPDKPSSVLIRAIEPVDGIEQMKQLAQTDDIEKLTNGPGKLCRALNITREHDGIDLTSAESPVFICSLDIDTTHTDIVSGARIGISKATDLQLRFYLKDSAYVSR